MRGQANIGLCIGARSTACKYCVGMVDDDDEDGLCSGCEIGNGHGRSGSEVLNNDDPDHIAVASLFLYKFIHIFIVIKRNRIAINKYKNRHKINVTESAPQ